MENLFTAILGWLLIALGSAATALLAYSFVWCVRQRYIAGAVRYAVMGIFSATIVALWIVSNLK